MEFVKWWRGKEKLISEFENNIVNTAARTLPLITAIFIFDTMTFFRINAMMTKSVSVGVQIIFIIALACTFKRILRFYILFFEVFSYYIYIYT